jgi:hypothetical protein
MKRALLLIGGGAAAVLAIGYGVRMAEHRAGAGVASLLPRNAIVFAHVPDFNRTVEDWHHSDIYQIYLEPAVQEFLQKPMSRAPKGNTLSNKMGELQELETKDVFIALTSATNDKPKFVAGFQFRCKQSVADRIIGGWKDSLNPSAKHHRVVYEKHEIDVCTQSTFSLAMAEDHNWFFASNDVDELKAVLDRADGRIKDRESVLAKDESFSEAIGAVPGSYSLLLYLQPKSFSERLAALSKSTGQATSTQQALLAQIRSVCATTRFDHGKLHDLVFVGMPKQEEKEELNRNSLALATNATIFYAASLVDFTKQIEILFPSGQTNPLGPAAQKISNALSAAGLTADDWKKAFGSEFAMISEWPEQRHWPSLVISTAVRDPARGRKIIDALLQGFGPDEHWQQTDRDGVHYWNLISASSWLSLRPVMGLSDRVWITGLDESSVETAVRHAQKPEAALADTDNYKAATHLVPTPTKFFAYADPAGIYSRLDATVRPILIMGAAFVPAANDYVDLSKFPPAEAITRHLSPIVSSQYYSGKGYFAESVGPLTMNQAGIGLAVLSGGGALAYQRFMPGGLKGLAPASSLPGSGSIGAGTGSHSPGTASPTPQPQRTP